MSDYEVIMLGGGLGGYLAAERAAGMGKKVLLIEGEHLGGVCLNHGCIPTKTLLNAAKLYHQMSGSECYGVSCAGAKFDLPTSLKWKQKVVEKLRGGIVYRMKRHGVEVIRGHGELMSAREVRVDGKTFRGQALIIATGSSAVRLAIPGADRPHVMTNREILELGALPLELAIIGAGSSVWSSPHSFPGSVSE